MKGAIKFALIFALILTLWAQCSSAEEKSLSREKRQYGFGGFGGGFGRGFSRGRFRRGRFGSRRFGRRRFRGGRFGRGRFGGGKFGRFGFY